MWVHRSEKIGCGTPRFGQTHQYSLSMPVLRKKIHQGEPQSQTLWDSSPSLANAQTNQRNGWRSPSEHLIEYTCYDFVVVFEPGLENPTISGMVIWLVWINLRTSNLTLDIKLPRCFFWRLAPSSLWEYIDIFRTGHLLPQIMKSFYFVKRQFNLICLRGNLGQCFCLKCAYIAW